MATNEWLDLAEDPPTAPQSLRGGFVLRNPGTATGTSTTAERPDIELWARPAQVPCPRPVVSASVGE
ncbi:hypothetical protein [Streptomyces aureocirculatus]|uniref:hypothetical protein n=1 Tax=Streptomyces aureocirculatus TaxID=67275 RepID=UPI000AECD96A|nr:hypothetical protein [Streptomyces aureocirculatus]